VLVVGLQGLIAAQPTVLPEAAAAGRLLRVPLLKAPLLRTTTMRRRRG